MTAAAYFRCLKVLDRLYKARWAITLICTLLA